MIRLMWSGERNLQFEGKHYRIKDALNVPRPIQPGGPKILVGGGGEKKTLKLLARHGDIGHWFGGNLEDLKRKREIFLQHCEAEGRDEPIGRIGRGGDERWRGLVRGGPGAVRQ